MFRQKDRVVDLIHGRMSSSEKEVAMDSLRTMSRCDIEISIAQQKEILQPIVLRFFFSTFCFLMKPLLMPCKFSVYTEANQTIVDLARPTLISQMMPDAGLDELAADVEERLISIMKAAI